MPAVSKRQYRMMRAILNGYISGDDCDRGCPPKSVAAKYVNETKDVKSLPETSGTNKGGRWDKDAYERDKARTKVKRIMRKLSEKEKKKKKIKKSEDSEAALEKSVLVRPYVAREIPYTDAMRVVGSGLFKLLRKELSHLPEESTKDIQIDSYTVHVRKHINDVYSGYVTEGSKEIYNFRNFSLPELTVALMSVFEWYTDEDINILDEIQDDIDDDQIKSTLVDLIEDYRRNQIANIYDELETLRQEIRRGTAVEIQEHNKKIGATIDKLDGIVADLVDKHNMLMEMAGKDIDVLFYELKNIKEKLSKLDYLSLDDLVNIASIIDNIKNNNSKPASIKPDKLYEIQSKLKLIRDSLRDMKEEPRDEDDYRVVDAFSVAPRNPEKVHDKYYMYLPKPEVSVDPSGKLTIVFKSAWTDEEIENFIKDLNAKPIKRR